MSIIANVSDWVGEYTTTTGTGTLVLSGPVPGFAQFENVTDGLIWYTILDGDNKETGTGTLVGGSSIERTTVHATLVDGLYSESGNAMALTGEATVYSTLTATAFEGAQADQIASEVPYTPLDPLKAIDVQSGMEEIQVYSDDQDTVLDDKIDTLDAQNVKITGAQEIGGAKDFLQETEFRQDVVVGGYGESALHILSGPDERGSLYITQSRETIGVAIHNDNVTDTVSMTIVVSPGVEIPIWVTNELAPWMDFTAMPRFQGDELITSDESYASFEPIITYGIAGQMGVVNVTEDGFSFTDVPDLGFYRLRGTAITYTGVDPDGFADTVGDPDILALIAGVAPALPDPNGATWKWTDPDADLILHPLDPPTTVHTGDYLYWAVDTARYLSVPSSDGEYVDLVTDQTINGNKTFVQNVSTQAIPVNANHLTTVTYMNDAILLADNVVRDEFIAADVVVLADANAYTDIAVTDMATVTYVDAGDDLVRGEFAQGDVDTLASANAYTDGEVADKATTVYVDQQDNIVRGEFALEDEAIRGEFVAADVVVLSEANDYTDLAVTGLASETYVDNADDVVRAEFILADGVVLDDANAYTDIAVADKATFTYVDDQDDIVRAEFIAADDVVLAFVADNYEPQITYGFTNQIAIVNATEDGFAFTDAPDLSYYRLRGTAITYTGVDPDGFADTVGDPDILELIAGVAPVLPDPNGATWKWTDPTADLILHPGDAPTTVNIGDYIYWSADTARFISIPASDGEYVDLVSDQAINGNKGFYQNISVSVAPINTQHVTRKDYVDTADNAVRSEFALEDTAIRSELIQGDIDTLASANAYTDISTSGLASTTYVDNADDVVRAEFIAADGVVRTDFALADTATLSSANAYTDTATLDMATNTYVNAGDDLVRAEFIAADVVVTNAYIAADTVVLNSANSHTDNLDAQNVKLTGNQSIAGHKTFTSNEGINLEGGSGAIGVDGDFRYNDVDDEFEGHYEGEWQAIGGSAGTVEIIGTGNVIETGTLGVIDYEVYEDGTIHQWGVVTTLAGGGVNVTLPYPLRSIFTAVYNGHVRSGGLNDWACNVNPVTTTNIDVYTMLGGGGSPATAEVDIWDYGSGQWVTEVTGVASPQSPNANMLINGDFNIWQRGVSFTASSGYTSDRWFISDSGATVSENRSPHIMPDGATSTCAVDINPVDNIVVKLRQVIEDGCTLMDGKTVTISAYFWSALGGTTVAISLGNQYGPDTVIQAGWNKVTHTISDYDTSVERGTFATDGLWFDIINRSTTNEGIAVTCCKVELGQVPTMFIADPIGDNLLKCQRYFEAFRGSLSDTVNLVATAYYSATTCYSVLPYTRKRQIPIVSTSSGIGFDVYAGGAERRSSSATFAQTSVITTRMTIVTPTATLGQAGWVAIPVGLTTHIYIDAEI